MSHIVRIEAQSVSRFGGRESAGVLSEVQAAEIRSSGELEELVSQAEAVVGGVKPQQLRDGSALRKQVARELSGVQAALDGLLVDRPRRNILRRAK